MTSPLDDDFMDRLRAAAPSVTADPARAEALARRITASAAPALAARARGTAAGDRDGVLAIASRWSRVAIPMAMAAGIGAIMLLTQSGSGGASSFDGSAPATDTVTVRLVASLVGGEGADGATPLATALPAALAAASGLAVEGTR